MKLSRNLYVNYFLLFILDDGSSRDAQHGWQDWFVFTGVDPQLIRGVIYSCTDFSNLFDTFNYYM